MVKVGLGVAIARGECKSTSVASTSSIPVHAPAMSDMPSHVSKKKVETVIPTSQASSSAPTSDRKKFNKAIPKPTDTESQIELERHSKLCLILRRTNAKPGE